MRTLDHESLKNILLGSTLLGTGGGGAFDMGMQRIESDLDAGKEFTLMTLDELDDDDMVVSPYVCGSPASIQESEKTDKGKTPRDIIALKALEKYFGEEFKAVISTELGGLNTALALSGAANMGISVLDADPAGRAVPELQHSSFFLDGISIAPLACASRTDTVIIADALDDLRVEAIVRQIAQLNDGFVGVADHPVKGKDVKASVIPGCLTYAEKLGAAVQTGDCKKVAEAGNGYLLFEGVMESYEYEERDGFTWGTSILRNGTDEYEIRFKNEYYLALRNGVIDVTVPDLICVVGSENAEPGTNPNFEKGDEVTVLGFPAPSLWRTETGLQVFGPGHFNIETRYVPIEEKYKCG